MAPKGKANIASTLIAPRVALPIAKAKNAIIELNNRVVARHTEEVEFRQRMHRESEAMMAPFMKAVQADKKAAAAMERRRRLITARRVPKHPTFPKVPHFDLKSQVRVGSILTIVVPPYDADWGDSSGYDGTTFGSWVAYKGSNPPRFNATNNIGDGGSAWASAGVCKFFSPAGRDSTYVRVGLWAPYEYDWRDDSNLFTAHTRGFIGIYVTSWDSSGGDFRVEVDRREPLWNDGTSWYEDHADSGSGNYPSDTYFMAWSSRVYAVWAWGGTSADAHSGSLAYSYAWGTLSVSVPFMVFEQWT